METKHISEILPAAVWLSRMEMIRHATDNFSQEIESFSDDELTAIPLVFPEFLDLSPKVLKIIHPRHAPELRRIIAYLNNLKEIQAAAWQRTIERCEAETLQTIEEYGKR